MKIRLSIIAIAVLVVASSFRKEETAKVFIARKGLYAGLVSPDVNIFIDGKIVCEISNNSFAMYSLPIGVHRFSAQWDGKTSNEYGEKFATDLEIKANQEYYFQLASQTKKLIAYAVLNEITANTWNKVKVDLKEDDCH